MLKRIGITAVLAGLTGFMAIAGISAIPITAGHPQPIGTFQWPMMASVWSFFLGMLVAGIADSRQRQAQALANLIR